MNRPLNILLADDDFVFAKVVKKYLTNKGFHVVYCQDGISAFKEFQISQFELCLFDIMMPYKDGYELAEEIKTINKEVAILFISSKELSEDKIKAFKAGADDYITKPFDVEELFCRIKAILRRKNPFTQLYQAQRDEPSQYKIGQYVLDHIYQKLTIGDDEKKLTTRETKLLEFLYLHKNKSIERGYILNEIWGDNDYYKGRSMDVFISRLRRYLKKDPNIQIINIHSVGFKFVF